MEKPPVKQMLGDRVLVKMDNAEEKTKGGLYITVLSQEPSAFGTVVSAGPKSEMIEQGARVRVSKSSCTEIEIEEGGIMVLGNDFGTVKYVNDVITDSNGFGEIKGTTVRNMKKHLPKLFTNKTFFTNFHLGIRTNKDAKMMVKIEELSDGYKIFCNDFFRMQLDLVKPKLVVCLGHHVKNALISLGGVFEQWEPKYDSLEKLYAREGNKYIVENNGIKFIVIPHPCYPVNLLKPPYLKKLNEFLNCN